MITPGASSPFPGLVLKAWALLQCNGVTSTTLIRGFNVTSASRLGVGQHQVVFTTALSGQQQMLGTHNANNGSAYSGAAVGNNGSAAGTNGVATAIQASGSPPTSSDVTGQVYVAFYD